MDPIEIKGSRQILVGRTALILMKGKKTDSQLSIITRDAECHSESGNGISLSIDKVAASLEKREKTGTIRLEIYQSVERRGCLGEYSRESVVGEVEVYRDGLTKYRDSVEAVERYRISLRINTGKNTRGP